MGVSKQLPADWQWWQLRKGHRVDNQDQRACDDVYEGASAVEETWSYLS